MPLPAALNDVPTRIEARLEPGRVYRLRTRLFVKGADEAKAPALVAIQFFDEAGEALEGRQPGFMFSTRYGSFRYLGLPGRDGEQSGDMEFVAPPGAKSFVGELHAWKAQSIAVIESLELTLSTYSRIDKCLISKPLSAIPVLASGEEPVKAFQSYELAVGMAAEPESSIERIDSKSLVATLQFFDAQGELLAVPEDFTKSSLLGAYRYFDAQSLTGKAEDAGTRRCRIGFQAPAGAASVRYQVRPWRTAEPPAVTSVSLSSSDVARPIQAEGWLDISDGNIVQLTVDADYNGDQPSRAGLIEVLYLDGAGQRVRGAGQGLSVSTEFGPYTYLSAVPAPSGVREVQRVFVRRFIEPPEGAVRARWRLRGWDDALSVKQALVAALPKPESVLLAWMPNGGQCDTLKTDQARDVLASLNDGAAAQAVMRGELHPLAAAFCSINGAHWLKFATTLSGQGQVSTSSSVVLQPVFMDGHGRVLNASGTPGISQSKLVGPYRHPLSGLDVITGAGSVEEYFLVPEGADCALVMVFQMGKWPSLTPVVPLLEPVSAELVRLPTADPGATTAQLQWGAELAEALWDPRTRFQVYAALAAARPDDKNAQRRSKAAAAQLLELDPAWVPSFPPVPIESGDPKSILHLLKVISPDEHSGGAVRSWNTLRSQLDIGFSPVALMPFRAPKCDETLASWEAHGSFKRVNREGVEVNYLDYPGFEARSVFGHELLQFEAVHAIRLAHEKRSALVHAASGYRGYDNAVVGATVAQACDLPFVYEVRSFHEHTWRPLSAEHHCDALTRMRMAKEDAMMARSDAVVTIAEAMVEKLCDRGVPREKLHCVPNCVGAEFQDYPDFSESRKIRERLGFRDSKVIGYISNFALREGHEILLESFARLVHRGLNIRLLFVGEGPQREAVQRAAYEAGVAGKVHIEPGVKHADVRAWYQALDLLITPRVADYASDYVTPLKPFEAMAMGVPVLLSDRPVAPEIVGSDEGRGWMFPTGDPEALSATIEAILDAPDIMQQKADAARRWVLRERVWSSMVKRYAAIYGAARAAHAQRRDGHV